jgi:hypothetical protein
MLPVIDKEYVRVMELLENVNTLQLKTLRKRERFFPATGREAGQ